MFVLYIGGQKSGKSKLAQNHTIKLSNRKKPFYIATYDDSFGDKVMKKKIQKHKKMRKNRFKTIFEYKNLTKIIKKNHTFLIDCISMWIFNNIKSDDKYLIKQLRQLKKLKNKKTNIVFVLNDISHTLVSSDKLTNDFITKTGTIGQYLAKICNEVYEVRFGIATKIKG
jgi:adenosylcobinamide kinase/adenosylcobinamide-phosphate guanylyltransferase